MLNNYYVKRTLRVVVTIWAVVSFTFALIRLLPGGPMVQMRARLVQQGYSPSQIEALMETYTKVNPDQPLYVQYIDYMGSLLQLNMGDSISKSRTVEAIIGGALPWTVLVAVSSVILIFAIAITWGAVMAYWEGTRFDVVSSAISILLSAIPFYVLGMLLVIFLGYEMGWFPVRYRISNELAGEPLSVKFVIDALHHAALPILSMAISGAGLQALAMRGNSISILGKDYVEVARLRGLSDRRIAITYVARNAILPMYTGFLTLIAFYLGGTVIIEEIFTYQGIGYYMFQALEARDYPLMMGVFIIITTALVLSVYIADLTYGMIDPRIKSGDSSEAY
ncbi:MAG: ABC transporter permease [Haloarculaceae archaeon]